ncbi:MAG: FtsW/RodA/SpoVE family cell cycle protein, partial [Actinomycetales bacterium]|nr:FtsW/RodA/SpoVE family cell cycle protein [Actinomycetales bacterium]
MSTEAPTQAATRNRKKPTRRWVELLLLILAWGIGLLGTMQIGWVSGEGMTTRLWVTAGVVGGLALAAHITIRIFARYADPIMLPVATLLTMLGLLMIYRIDVASARRAVLSDSPMPTPDVYSQLTWFSIAIILFIAVLVLLQDHRRLARYTYTSGLIGLVLLVLPLVPAIGTTVNGATLWIRVGDLSFQPAEAAKILLTIFFAGYLVAKRDSLAVVRTKFLGIELPRLKDLGPLVIAWLVSLAVLVFERDLGTSLLFFGLFVAMLYIATQRRSWIILGALLFFAGAALAYYNFAHVRSRVTVWLDPWAYADTGGYQIVQAIFGLANGGVL